jgi:hypothetical protein
MSLFRREPKPPTGKPGAPAGAVPADAVKPLPTTNNGTGGASAATPVDDDDVDGVALPDLDDIVGAAAREQEQRAHHMSDQTRELTEVLAGLAGDVHMRVFADQAHAKVTVHFTKPADDKDDKTWEIRELMKKYGAQSQSLSMRWEISEAAAQRRFSRGAFDWNILKKHIAEKAAVTLRPEQTQIKADAAGKSVLVIYGLPKALERGQIFGPNKEGVEREAMYDMTITADALPKVIEGLRAQAALAAENKGKEETGTGKIEDTKTEGTGNKTTETTLSDTKAAALVPLLLQRKETFITTGLHAVIEPGKTGPVYVTPVAPHTELVGRIGDHKGDVIIENVAPAAAIAATTSRSTAIPTITRKPQAAPREAPKPVEKPKSLEEQVYNGFKAALGPAFSLNLNVKDQPGQVELLLPADTLDKFADSFRKLLRDDNDDLIHSEETKLVQWRMPHPILKKIGKFTEDTSHGSIAIRKYMADWVGPEVMSGTMVFKKPDQKAPDPKPGAATEKPVPESEAVVAVSKVLGAPIGLVRHGEAYALKDASTNGSTMQFDQFIVHGVPSTSDPKQYFTAAPVEDPKAKKPKPDPLETPREKEEREALEKRTVERNKAAREIQVVPLVKLTLSKAKVLSVLKLEGAAIGAA